MPTRQQLEQHYQRYNRKVNRRMNQLREEGRDIKRPVGSLRNATREDLRRRAVFGQRKANEVLNRRQSLRDPQGYPTPAAMQFRRWAYSTPANLEDVRQILTQARAVIEKTNK